MAVGLADDSPIGGSSGQSFNGGRTLPNQRRARVLCSYDAKDATELNLTGNEVIVILIKNWKSQFNFYPFHPHRLYSLANAVHRTWTTCTASRDCTKVLCLEHSWKSWTKTTITNKRNDKRKIVLQLKQFSINITIIGKQHTFAVYRCCSYWSCVKCDLLLYLYSSRC